MILAIDIGNTNIVVGCFDKDKIMFVERVATDRNKTELEYAISIKNVLEIYGLNPTLMDGGILSSVVPPLTNIMKRSAEKIIHGEVLVVGPGLKNGLNIYMDNPASMGSDLVTDAVAAIAEYQAPLIIIDMGTATTISVVDENKRYIGGMIMPGIQISIEALASRTSQLPHIGLDAPKKLIGKNTIDCMKSGILYGNASCIDGMIRRIKRDLNCEDTTVIATGGLAKAVVPYCEENVILDDELLLKGLRLIYEKNKEL